LFISAVYSGFAEKWTDVIRMNARKGISLSSLLSFKCCSSGSISIVHLGYLTAVDYSNCQYAGFVSVSLGLGAPSFAFLLLRCVPRSQSFGVNLLQFVAVVRESGCNAGAIENRGEIYEYCFVVAEAELTNRSRRTRVSEMHYYCRAWGRLGGSV
jgi:hypothetical protein